MPATAPQQLNGPEWDSYLFRDLAYIKQKRRYPAGRKVFLPAVLGTALLVILAVLTYTTFIGNTTAHPAATPVFITGMLSITVLLVANKFFGHLKFMAIPTPFDTQRNRQLVDQFLRSQHMVVFRHPGSADVFQIVSRNINPLKEQREVLVFIADDRRILVNSHFTNAGFSLVPGSRHHKQMAAGLQQYIQSVKA
jgi:hypothetical protein